MAGGDVDHKPRGVVVELGVETMVVSGELENFEDRDEEFWSFRVRRCGVSPAAKGVVEADEGEEGAEHEKNEKTRRKSRQGSHETDGFGRLAWGGGRKSRKKSVFKAGGWRELKNDRKFRVVSCFC